MKTGQIFIKGNLVTIDYVISRIVLDADRKCYKYGEGKIRHVLDLWKPEQIERYVSEVKRNILYKPTSTQNELESFVYYITGERNEHDIAVIKHFIWQTKRKMEALQVEYHLMPILFGKTGIGKSEAIYKFLEPIQGLYKAPNDMTVINDERSARILHDCYCIHFDEMAKASKVDVDRLKNVISSKHVTYRPMRSNDSATLSNRSTFIGASNTSIFELIYDPTSMRRFWQINVDDNLKNNWKEINSLSYLEMWQSINPLEDSPIKKYINDIADIQSKEFRNFFPLEEFLLDLCDEIKEDSNIIWNSSKEIYHSFKKWMMFQNRSKYVPTLAKFERSFQHFIVKKEGERVTYLVGDKTFIKKRINEGIRYNIRPRDSDIDLD